MLIFINNVKFCEESESMWPFNSIAKANFSLIMLISLAASCGQWRQNKGLFVLTQEEQSVLALTAWLLPRPLAYCVLQYILLEMEKVYHHI